MSPSRRGGHRGPAAGDDRSELGGEQVEGRRAVLELLRARRRPVRDLWMAEGVGNSPQLEEILRLAGASGIPVRRVPRARLDAAAGTDAPQGLLARAAAVPPADLGSLIRADRGKVPFLVVLDGVTDPHNLGALLRTALCGGATGAVIGRHRAAHLGPAAVKAAAGAVEYLPIALAPGIPAALAELRRAGVWTVGLDAGGATSLWDLEVASEPLALVLGAEGAGLSRLARERCEILARIPLVGPLPSLNVAAAGAVACFAIARQR